MPTALPSLPEAFASRVQSDPNAVALSYRGRVWTYAELDRRANQLARWIERTGGVSHTGDLLIPFCLQKGVDQVATMLAILKLGAAYVPIDPLTPPGRMQLCLEDSGARVVVTDSASRTDVEPMLAGMERAPRLLDLDLEAGVVSACPETRLGRSVDPDDLCYVMYTSGSTGRPKGVAIRHEGVARLVLETDYLDASPADVFAQAANVAFDAATFEIWGALLNGARLALLDPDDVVDPDRFREVLEQERVSVLFLTTGLFNQHAAANPRLFTGLRYVMFGGEAASAPILRGLWDAGALPEHLYNVYGPTENTTYSTWYEIRTRPDEGASVPIGKAISNSSCYVVSSEGELVGEGEVGELLVGGLGLARSYLNLPDLTGERFVELPPPVGERVYRTGDLVRRLPSGDLVFVGRVDNQVKIRGFRIELEEIELALRAHPAVEGAEVLAEEDVTGTKRLAAYVVASDPDAVPTVADLRAVVQSRLPAYMVPAVFRRLDAFPLAATGKVDRRALPERVVEVLTSDVAHVSPRDELEAEVREVWARHLGLPADEIGVDAEFYGLGGQSLLAAAIVTELADRHAVRLRMGDLFASPTVARLAAHLRSLSREEASEIERQADDAPVPLSFSQEQVWLHQQADPRAVYYNEPLDITIPEAIDVGALEEALNVLVERHEALRLRLCQDGGRPAQRFEAHTRVRLRRSDLRHLPRERALEEGSRIATAQAKRPFDLASEAPIRFHLVLLGDHLARLYLVCHHVAIDGVAMFHVFLPELQAAYRAAQAGRPVDLPALPHRYRDLVASQRSRAEVADWEPQLAFWSEKLRGLEPLDLPTDRPRKAGESFAGGRVTLELPSHLTRRLRELARAEGASSFHVLLGAFKALLYRYTGQRDVAVATVVAGRDVPGLERQIGDFLNTMILRTQLPEGGSFLDVLARTKEVCEDAFAHQDLPFQLAARQISMDPSRERSLPIQVAFVLEPESPRHSAGWEMNQLEVHTGTAKFDLTMELDERGGRVIGRVEYRSDLFERETIERLIRHYEQLLTSIAASPGRRVDDLELLDEAERDQVLYAWNDTDVHLEGARLLHGILEDSARRWPDLPALVDAEGTLSVLELDTLANRLAHRLVELGVKPEQRVAVWTDRTALHVVGQAAVLKSGAAFVPMGPDEPLSRAVGVFEDASVTLIVHDDAHAGRVLEAGVRGVLVSRTGWADRPSSPPAVEVTPETLAYVIYTSGSTGRPKGALIPHGPIAERALWVAAQVASNPGDLCLHLSSLGFDGSFVPTWWQFPAGGGAVIPTREELQDPDALIELCRRHGVRSAFATPALWHLLKAPLAAAGVRFDWVMGGGERFTSELVEGLRPCAERIFNGYGPTEATIMASMWEAPPEPTARPPIGPPIGNVKTYVLDGRMQPVPIGIAGELYIGGRTIGRGYLERPELQARAFVPDPFDPSGEGRLYRTGDVARWLPCGNLDFLGRRDHQVKVRGYRIELGEIEKVLLALESVKEATVIVLGEGSAQRLVAYVVGPAADAGPELRERLQAELPAFMIPAAIVPLDVLPLTINGKVDRRALPEPPNESRRSGDERAAPRTPLERALLERFRATLKNEDVGIEDDFFAVGGDSLAAMQMAADAAAAGLDLAMRDLLRHRTVAGLAEVMGRREDADRFAKRPPRYLNPAEASQPKPTKRIRGELRAPESLVPFRDEGARTPLFCVHPAGGSAACYRTLAEHMPDRPFYGLECVGGYAGETIESMARTYLASAREVQPEGPYLFAGWSFGGIVAFEMARQAEAEGLEVGGLVLLDSRPTHNEHQRKFLAHMTDDSAAILALIGRHLAKLAGRPNPFDYLALREIPDSERMERFYEQVEAEALFSASLTESFVRRFVDDFATCHEIMGSYQPASPCQADVLLLRATEVSEPYPGFPAMEVPIDQDPDLSYGWNDLTSGQVTVRTIGSTHESIVFEPHASRAAALISEELREVIDGEQSRILALPSLSAADWGELLRHMDRVPFSAGETLIEEGARDRAVYLVVAGHLEVVSQQLELRVDVGPGTVLGEVAFIDARPRTASVVARSQTGWAYSLSPEAHMRLASERPRLANVVLLDLARVVADRLRGALV